jgi:hypothetical protein
MSGKLPKSDFVSSLDVLASAGGRWLWKSHLRDGLRARLPKGMALLLLAPALAVAVVGLGWVLGQPWKLPLGLVLVLCPLPPLHYLGYHFVQLWRQEKGRRAGLAVFDEALDLKDRLQTADEFLAIARPTPFMEAAIADAGAAVERASQAPLDWDWGKPWGELRRLALFSTLAAFLLVTGVFLPTASRTGAAPDRPGGGSPGLAGKLPLPPATKPPVPAPRAMDPSGPKEERPEEQVRKGPKGEPAPAKINENPSNQLAGRDKISVGTSEGGQTSQAASAGRSSQSQGMPGSQAPSSPPEEQRETTRKDVKPGKEMPAETATRKVEDQSGATAGRGSSGGSSRNPAATDWASKDRTEAADNEEFEQEQDVDDEDSESEARGGLQPNLRDRRPPVNRDLSIGFGNMASEDSNGRGGPGDRKKSRGVAALVLGVPVPDQVKGQPNPGRVKVTQERIQPQGEDMPAAAAADRGRRNSPAGHLSERTLDSSMKRIVRDYFLKTQAADARASETQVLENGQPPDGRSGN